MTVLSASKARAMLYTLLDQVAKSHKPVHISGKRNHGILVSEEDWRSIQETLYLVSIPGMRKSIRDGLQTPLETCKSTLHW